MKTYDHKACDHEEKKGLKIQSFNGMVAQYEALKVLRLPKN